MSARPGTIPRVVAALLGLLLVALLLPAGASASFHLVKVREVYPGSAANPDSEYIVLQMYAPGQNFVGGHTVTAYSPTGALEEYTFGASVANGDSQRTILVASPEAEAQFGVDADLEITKNALDPAGGAVCWEALDCVSWGNYSGPALPSPSGTKAAAPADGSGLRRSIARGCSTLLEGGDDTDVSAADFAPVAAAGLAPRPNSATPTEKSCPAPPAAPDTTIVKAPKKKTSSRKASFSFTSDKPGASFSCELDGDGFESCESPQVYARLARGAHVFKVRASANGKTDATPASYRWKVRKRR